MTDHARASYRNHRRATWGLVIAVVVAIAAVLVPLGSAKGPTAPIKLFDVCLAGGFNSLYRLDHYRRVDLDPVGLAGNAQHQERVRQQHDVWAP